MLPLAGLASEDELVHKILVLVAAPLTLWIVFKSFTVEGNLPFVIQALIGLGILLIAAFIEALAPMEVVLTIAGATLLAFAHVRRWMRYRQSAR